MSKSGVAEVLLADTRGIEALYGVGTVLPLFCFEEAKVLSGFDPDVDMSHLWREPAAWSFEDAWDCWQVPAEAGELARFLATKIAAGGDVDEFLRQQEALACFLTSAKEDQDVGLVDAGTGVADSGGGGGGVSGGRQDGDAVGESGKVAVDSHAGGSSKVLPKRRRKAAQSK